MPRTGERKFSRDFFQFVNLINKHSERKKIFSRIPEEYDAEDVIQETLLAIIENFDKFRGDSAFLTWVFSITNHKIADYWRKSINSKEKGYEDFNKIADRVAEDKAEDKNEWLDELIFQDELENTIKTMNPVEKEIFQQRIRGDSFVEMSKTAVKNYDTVRSTYRRVLLKIRRKRKMEEIKDSAHSAQKITIDLELLSQWKDLFNYSKDGLLNETTMHEWESDVPKKFGSSPPSSIKHKFKEKGVLVQDHSSNTYKIENPNSFEISNPAVEKKKVLIQKKKLPSELKL
ncbi:MAG: hypothetical protein COS76_01985 [Candidatus Portnoybacteria bacterium CG06_land_8_20_14_3_00_39_12]|uniref:RNA polymerase sigma-70 region 2 domain-containing protein n=1 Tax=Candidatus Portnoybacteria bacterium CG06_land_8_20_14_3_00_39_12 TaxID=1974809 RepID=A0A2M7AX96_9BACT|nr:MAG: hypothetical protein COS76_01985 [Candidatus Portnoybacteria bacterium CG06_land_8_20_14_3_00_39_12]